MIESCTRCGCTIDYACMCPDGRYENAVPYKKARTVTVPSYAAVIFVGGDLARARAACRLYCDAVGECVTVEPTAYVYTDGETDGVRVGFINYARFPREPAEIFNRAVDLAERLIVILGQESASVVADDRSVWLTTRED